MCTEIREIRIILMMWCSHRDIYKEGGGGGGSTFLITVVLQQQHIMVVGGRGSRGGSGGGGGGVPLSFELPAAEAGVLTIISWPELTEKQDHS